jgi:hypothetical protein
MMFAFFSFLIAQRQVVLGMVYGSRNLRSSGYMFGLIVMIRLMARIPDFFLGGLLFSIKPINGI